eukprot:755290-Hanusia_phi.AAC.4
MGRTSNQSALLDEELSSAASIAFSMELGETSRSCVNEAMNVYLIVQVFVSGSAYFVKTAFILTKF